MQTLTLEDINKLHGGIKQQQAQPSGVLSLEQVNQMHGGIVQQPQDNSWQQPVQITDNRSALPKSEYDVKIAQFAQQKNDARQTYNPEKTKVGNFLASTARGFGKGVAELGNLAATTANFATGNQLINDPRYQFGTASRKVVSEGLKGKNAGEKVGRTIFDIASLFAGEGAVNLGVKGLSKAPLIGDVLTKASTAAKLAEFTGKRAVTRFAGSVAPKIASNVAQGALFAAQRGDRLTPGNVIADTLFASVPGVSRLVGITNAKVSEKTANELKDFITKNPQYKKQLVEAASKGIDKAGEQLSKISGLKGALKANDSYNYIADNINDNKEVFGGLEPAKSVGSHIIRTVNNFLDSKLVADGNVQTSDIMRSLDEFNQSGYDGARKVLSAINEPVNTASILHRIESSPIFRDLSQSDVKSAENYLTDNLIRDPDARSLGNIAITPIYDIASKVGGNVPLARQIQQSAREELYQITDKFGGDITNQMKQIYKEMQLNAVAKNFLSKLDESKYSNGSTTFSKRSTSQMGATLAAITTGHPLAFIPAMLATGKIFDVLSAANIRRNIQNPKLLTLARELGVIGNKAAERKSQIKGMTKAVGLKRAKDIAIERIAKKEKDAIKKQKFAESYLNKKAVNKARGLKRAKDIAIKREAYIPEDKLPVIDFGPGKPNKRSNLPVIR